MPEHGVLLGRFVHAMGVVSTNSHQNKSHWQGYNARDGKLLGLIIEAVVTDIRAKSSVCQFCWSLVVETCRSLCPLGCHVVFQGLLCMHTNVVTLQNSPQPCFCKHDYCHACLENSYFVLELVASSNFHSDSHCRCSCHPFHVNKSHFYCNESGLEF